VGEPYRVTEATPVYGCSMGLRSDVMECRHCLCGPCKKGKENMNNDNNKRTSRRRIDKALDERLKDKKVSCKGFSERHLSTNLVREANGSYFKEGISQEKFYPYMCVGCLRPLSN
jgi:hypothetical protein